MEEETKTNNPVVSEENESGATGETTVVAAAEEAAPHPLTQYAKKWDDLDLSSDLLRSIYSMGFESMSEIQQKAIYPIMQGKDVIAQAQSGTGKTGSFTISALTKINVTQNAPQAIIIAPTHELVSQIHSVATSLSNFIEGIRIRTLLGGTNVQEEVQDLRENPPHLVIGCTGRIHDMIRRRALQTSSIKLCVLDEADEMLSNGFRDQIYYIFQQLPSDVQIALFSATMPDAMHRISERFMRDPVRIIMKPEELNLDGIKQYFVALHDDREKYVCLRDLFERMTLTQTMIYANNVERVINLYEGMKQDGFPVCCIHSNMTKPERNAVIKEFRQGAHRFMISSNLTARGIDIQQVSTVINYDIPRSVETYLHRIGRSGRFGRKGLAINFITKRDVFNMKNIERHYGVTIDELPENYQTLF